MESTEMRFVLSYFFDFMVIVILISMGKSVLIYFKTKLQTFIFSSIK